MISTSGVTGRPASACAVLILHQVAAAPREQLEAVRLGMWAEWGDKRLTDEEAEAIETKIAARLKSKFDARPHRASPDREASRNRRRRLGGSSALPDTLRHHYTEGQRAVLCVIAGEVKARACCDLPIEKIAALAGVCRTTVQNALREARKLKHVSVTERPVRGRKSLTNVICITSTEWLAWLKRGAAAHRAIGFKAFNPLHPTKKKDQKERGVRDKGSASERSARPHSRDDACPIANKRATG